MSFPKAKIKRFNEIPTSTPSPADYNVDFKQKPKLGVISQNGRFAEHKSPSVSDTGSTQSTPCFKTPTLAKKKLLGSASKQKKQYIKVSEREILNEKTVECKNKDLFIKELTEQLEELKKEMYNINCEKKRIAEIKITFEEELCKLQKLHDAEDENILKKHENEISKLNDEISKFKNEIEQMNEESENLKSDQINSRNQFKNEIRMYKEDIHEKNKLIEKATLNVKKMEEERNHILEMHKNELENLRTKHKDDVQNVEFEMLKCVHDMQKSLDEEKRQNRLNIEELQKCFAYEIENLKKSFKDEKELLTNQNVARINQLEENIREIKALSDIQFKEKCTELENYWKSKLEKHEEESAAILKECQAISEYNIIQSELEKNEYKMKYEIKIKKFNELEKKYDDVYLNYKQLQTSYSNAQNKLYRLIKELREKEGMKNEIIKLLSEKQTYETTISRCQKTIDILKRRLTESDQDVEQLKNEISENEIKILEYEQKFIMFATGLKEAQTLNEELETKNQLTLKITHEEIIQIKEDLLHKVEGLRFMSEEHQRFYEIESQKNEVQKKELCNMLEDQQILIEKSKILIDGVNIELEKVLAENSDLSSQVESLTCSNKALQTDVNTLSEEKKNWTIEKKELYLKIDILKNEVKQLRNYEETLKINSDRLTQSDKTNIVLVKENLEQRSEICALKNQLEITQKQSIDLEKLNEQYREKIEEQKNRIAPFNEQLEAYELEMDNLKNAKDFMENEAKDLGTKFAQILGHQNHKQKIKYMMGLKTKNDDLLKVNMELEGNTKTQERKIEKLKKENIELKKNMRKLSIFEDKENMLSPNKSIKCESPGPLRDRNKENI